MSQLVSYLFTHYKECSQHFASNKLLPGICSNKKLPDTVHWARRNELAELQLHMIHDPLNS